MKNEEKTFDVHHCQRIKPFKQKNVIEIDQKKLTNWSDACCHSWLFSQALITALYANTFGRTVAPGLGVLICLSTLEFEPVCRMLPKSQELVVFRFLSSHQRNYGIPTPTCASCQEKGHRCKKATSMLPHFGSGTRGDTHHVPGQWSDLESCLPLSLVSSRTCIVCIDCYRYF